MNDPTLTYAVIDDWKGLQSNHRKGPGMAAQDNLSSNRPGQINTRLGMLRITFESGGSATSADGIDCFSAKGPEGTWILYAATDGTIQAGLNPAAA